MQASNGLLYGVTSKGGAQDGGVLFSFNTSTSSYSKLHDFTFITGIEPDGGLVEQSPGVLYGVTYRGGSVVDFGVLYSYSIVGNSYLSLIDFNGSNGKNPRGSLCLTPNGYLLGLTSSGGLNTTGVVFGYRVSTGILTNHVNLSNLLGHTLKVV
jgi:uncharacterized repeat protein (TIGR03803 family)